jgi:hypothetical protein
MNALLEKDRKKDRGETIRRLYVILFLVLFTFFLVKFVLPQTAFGGDITKLPVLILLIVLYLTGILILFGSFSVISSLHATILGAASRIHYFFFGKLLNEGLKKTRFYKKTKALVINSVFYRELSKYTYKLLGVKKVERENSYEVIICPSCQRKIPSIGDFCPYCKAPIKKA